MNVLAVDARGQRLVDLRHGPEPSDHQSLDPPCPLALAVVTHRGKVLLGLNRWRGEWELPGGLIEGGETARAAGCRELLEETGLAIDAHQLMWVGLAVFDLVDPARRELAAVYAARLSAMPTIMRSDEFVEVGWFDLDDPPANHSPLDLALAAASADLFATHPPASP